MSLDFFKPLEVGLKHQKRYFKGIKLFSNIFHKEVELIKDLKLQEYKLELMHKMMKNNSQLKLMTLLNYF